MPHAARFTVRTIDPRELSQGDVARWSALQSQALEPNAYLSPHVVRAAARLLTPGDPPWVHLVERHAAGGTELVGVAVVRGAAARRLLRHRLVGYTTNQTLLGGLLLQAASAGDALTALLAHLRRQARPSAALELPKVWADGATVRLCRALQRDARVLGTESRAVLTPAQAAQQLGSAALSQRMRELARCMRRLREHGEVAWHWHDAEHVTPAVIETFLRLEHLGWKREEGSSLRSRASTEQYFREIVTSLAHERRVFFTELSLDGVAIASTCNLLDGPMAFAYKIGWDVQHRRFAPGWLNEAEFMRHAAARLGAVSLVDSGAAADSFINALWCERRPIATLVLPLDAGARVALAAEDAARSVKRKLILSCVQTYRSDPFESGH